MRKIFLAQIPLLWYWRFWESTYIYSVLNRKIADSITVINRFKYKLHFVKLNNDSRYISSHYIWQIVRANVWSYFIKQRHQMRQVFYRDRKKFSSSNHQCQKQSGSLHSERYERNDKGMACCIEAGTGTIDYNRVLNGFKIVRFYEKLQVTGQ